MSDRSTEQPVKDDRRVIWSWALYDFANQPFTTLVVTFVYATFFTQVIAEDEITGTSLWSAGVTVSGILVAIVSPYLGALADRGTFRKRLLAGATITSILATAGLYFPVEGQVFFALMVFVVADVAFELSYVFYNAFLPDITSPRRIGRVSGLGWFVGYLGGLAALVGVLFIFIFPETPPFGLDPATGEHIRATNVLVAAWYAIFALPLFFVVPEPAKVYERPAEGLIRATNRQLKQTYKKIRSFRNAFWMLAARFFYNDGLVTIFAFGGIYAAGTFGFDTEGIIIFGIVLNIAAGIGAFIFGYVDDWIGGKNTIMITLVGLCGAVALAAAAPTVTWFWVSGILIGILVGPNQSASRSLLGRFTPIGKETEFYGFFAFSGKLTAFMGPMLLGWVTAVTGTQRAGVATVLIFFIIGGLLLLKVNEKEGREMAEEQSVPTTRP